MKIQNYEGLYVYFVDYPTYQSPNKKVITYYFQNWDDFLRYYNVGYKPVLNQFGSFERIWTHFIVPGITHYSSTPRYYCLSDQNGLEISTAEIWSHYVDFEKRKRLEIKRKFHNRRHGRRNGVYGRCYAIRTVRSRRNYFVDPYVQELQIDVKYRSKANPPSSWDREKRQHVEKCWKRQSKRSHQWKE